MGDQHVTPPDPSLLAIHYQKDVRARRIILNVVKDDVIPHLSRKKIARDMSEALAILCQSDTHNRKMVLKEKLRSTKISKLDTVASYLTRISQVHDE